MTEANLNEDPMLMTALPPGFQLVRVKEGEVELCPGIILAGASRIPYGVELPPGVVYCFRKKDAALAKGIKRVPYHMAGLPEVKGCVPLLLPASLQLVEGVRLILGAKLPLNTVLPPNVMIVQRDSVAIARGIIPKGMTEVQLSTVLKTPANFRLNQGSKKGNPVIEKVRPSALMMVQMHTTVTLPVGCEVAPGCEIAKNTDDMSLPHGVQLIRCTDECLALPSFMTPLDVFNGVEVQAPQNTSDMIDPAVVALNNCRDELELHKRMGHTCCILPKPDGFEYGHGVEMILSQGPGQWMGDVSASGMRPLTVDEYPAGLSSSDLLRYLPKVTASPESSRIASKLPMKDKVVDQQVLELVQLSPRFDFPEGASPFPGWQFFPRPFDMRLPLGVYLLHHSPDHFSSASSAGQLPSFVHIVHIPERHRPPNFVGTGPVGGESSYVPTPLPAGLIACEFLPGVCRPLPEGATLAPGLRVHSNATVAAMMVRAQNPPSSASSSSFEGRRKALELQISKLLPLHACLVSREQPIYSSEKSKGKDTPCEPYLPPGVMSAGETIIIPHLPPNVEVLLLAARFEVPAGVRIAAGAVLGHCTQLSPGTIINRDLCVLEWPREIMIPRTGSCASTPWGSEKSTDPLVSTDIRSPAESRKSSVISNLDINMSQKMNPCPPMGLPRGQELVRLLPSSYSLPLGIGQALPYIAHSSDDLYAPMITPYSTVLSMIGGLIINLPTDGYLQTASPQQLAEQVEVYSLSDVIIRMESQLEVEKAARPGLLDPEFIVTIQDALEALKTAGIEADPTEPPLLPQGAVFVRRSGPDMQLPSSMAIVENSQLPFVLRSALTASAKCTDRAQIERMSAVERMLLLGPNGFKAVRVTPTDLEVVQLAPKYALPAGTEIGPGVFVLSRPHWLMTPLWVEMVTMIPAAEPHSDGEDDTDKEIVRKREMLRCLRAVRLPHPSHPDWPPGADLILVPDDIEVYSFGKAAPGFEALVRSTVRTVHAADTTVTSTSEKTGDLPGWLELMPLPLAHFLVQRSRIVLPPVGLKMGFGVSYERLVNNLKLPPGAEVVRVCASFHLPLGITLHSTQILTPKGKASVILSSSVTPSPAQLHLQQQRELLDACNTVYESVQMTAGQEVFSGIRIIAQPLNCIDWLSHLQSSMATSGNLLTPAAATLPPTDPSNLAFSHPYAFVRIIDTSTRVSGALSNSNHPPLYILPAGAIELENSSTIVSIAFDDPLTELSVLERERGFNVSDVIKVVLLPLTLPPLRAILRQHGKAIEIAKPMPKKPQRSSIVVLDKVVHPVIKITRGKPEGSSGGSSSSDGPSRFGTGSGGSGASGGPGGGLGSEFATRRNSSSDSPLDSCVVAPKRPPPMIKMGSFNGHSSIRAHSVDFAFADGMKKEKRELASVIAARAAKEKSELIAYGIEEKIKGRNNTFKRRVSFNGSVVHSAEVAAMALSAPSDGGAYNSISANLPAAETLIISLAAAERVIRGLEKENNTYRERQVSLTEKHQAEVEKSAQYKGHIQRVELEVNMLKKSTDKARYDTIRDDKQVELRVREMAAMKGKYTELKNRTEPLIASLTTKLHYFESSAEADEQEKRDAFAAELKKIREEAEEKYNRMVESNQKIVGSMQEGYRNVLNELCGGMGRLGMEIASEAMRRQERASGAFQRAVGHIREISLLSTGQQQQESEWDEMNLNGLATHVEGTPGSRCHSPPTRRTYSAMTDTIRPLDDVSMMSDDDRQLPDPIMTAKRGTAPKMVLNRSVLSFSNGESATRIPEFESSLSSKKELVRSKSALHSKDQHSRPSSTTPSVSPMHSIIPYSILTRSVSTKEPADTKGHEDGRPVTAGELLYPSMFLDQSISYSSMSFPSVGNDPLSDLEKQAAVQSWVDAEGLQSAVKRLLESHHPATGSSPRGIEAAANPLLAKAASLIGIGKASSSLMSIRSGSLVEQDVPDDTLKDWVTRITSLHQMVSVQEEERYLRALSLGEREARLLLRRQKAAEQREDMAHRNLQGLLQLEAKVGNIRKARSARGRAEKAPVLFSESSLCNSDIGGGGLSLASATMLPNLQRPPFDWDGPLSPLEGDRDRDGGIDWDAADEFGTGEQEYDRKSLETISQLKDSLHKTQELLLQPTKDRLTGLSDGIRDLRDMETSLRLYGMALKKQVLALQQQLSLPSAFPGDTVVTQSTESSVSDEILPAYLSEVDRRALQHRTTCLQSQLSNIDMRAASLKKEIESERMFLVHELFTYESCVGEASVPGLSSTLSDMRVWARTSEAAVSRNIAIDSRLASESSQLTPFTPTTRSLKTKNKLQLDPLAAPYTGAGPMSLPPDMGEKRTSFILSGSRSVSSKDKGYAPTAMSHLNIGWKSSSNNNLDLRNRSDNSVLGGKGIRGISAGVVGAAAGHRVTASLVKPLMGFDSRMLRDAEDKGRLLSSSGSVVGSVASMSRV